MFGAGTTMDVACDGWERGRSPSHRTRAVGGSNAGAAAMGNPMANRSFYGGTDTLLLSGGTNFKTKIDATPAAFGLTAGQATAYDAVFGAFAAAMAAIADPDNRTRSKVAVKDDAAAKLRKMTSDYAKIINGNASVTAAQKISLGLSVRKTPSPIPAPIARPAVDLIAANGFTVSIAIHDSAASNKRGKAKGAQAAWVYTYVGETYPSDPTWWDFQGATTKAKYDIVFDNTLPGGTQVWVCCAWINAKQEAGPVSLPITTNLQGGGSIAAGKMNTPGVKLAA